MSTILGMYGTGSFDSDSVPGSWREVMLRLYPYGKMRITGILSMMQNFQIDNELHKWQCKTFPEQGGAITGIYTDLAMGTAYVDSGAVGDTLYVKVDAATVQHFRKGHQVVLRDQSHPDVDVNAKVEAVTVNGANSQIAIRLLEADDNGASTNLSDADYIRVIGNVNPQGGVAPVPLAYKSTWYENYTQITRNSLWLTRTAKKTRLRGPSAYEEAKREALELHGAELERNLLHSVLSEGVGSNGEPEYTAMGMLEFIRTYSSDNVDDYTLNTDYSGYDWIVGGSDWLNTMLYQIFRYGDNRERLAICGDGALQAINNIAESMGHVVVNQSDKAYGLSIDTWVMPAGRVNLMSHPLLNQGDNTDYYSMIIFDPADLMYCYIDDTTFYPSAEMEHSNGPNRMDAVAEEYLTEATYEFHYPEKWGYLTGVGKDNALA